MGVKTIWISNPTWANHPQIFHAADLQVQQYSYVTPDATGLDFSRLLGQLETAARGDAVLFHAVCHNPTGFDFDREQWRALRDVVRDRGLIPVFDFAYQGFSESIETDPWPVHWFVQDAAETLICTSFSKNMGLYGERVGALTAVARSADRLPPVISQVKSLIRTYYSTPPLQGGSIAEMVLNDSELRQLWYSEVDQMRERIQRVREQFVTRLTAAVPQRSFRAILDQRGMFSFSGLNREQAIRLRDEYAVYLVESGRINIAGINDRNLERLCQTIGQVVSG
jgi:aspartate/tyrosine/aromatic aminotransferase